MNSDALKIAKERENATKRTGHLSMKSKVTLESAHALVHPLAGHIVETADLQYALNVLEQTTLLSETAGKKLTKYIANDILPFVSNIDESARMITKISNDDEKNILESRLEDIRTAARIVNNRTQLSKRFNIQNTVIESCVFPDKTDSIISLCEMIDTYNMKPHIKMNIALENITYEYYRNNVPARNIASVALEYFLTRDSQIPDKVYKNYKMVLENNTIYEAEDYGNLYDAVMANDGEEYKKQVRALLSDVIQNDNRLEGIDNCATEADIVATLEELKDFIRTNYPSSKERACIYQAIQLFPLAFGVSKDFVDMEVSKRFDLIDMNECLEKGDKEVAKENAITFGETIQSYDANELLHALDSYNESSEDIKDVLTDFKADQNKSMGKFKSIINKIHARKPEDIIDGMPNIFNIVRTVFILGTACITPIGPVIAASLGLVDFLINRKINDKQCDELLEKLRNERSAVHEKIKKTKSEKTKNELIEYDKHLSESIEKVKDYADSLSNDEHDDDRDYESPDGGDDDLGDFDLDFDMDFESTIMQVGRLLSLSESLLEFSSRSVTDDFNKKLYKTMNILAENSLLPRFMEVAKYANISANMVNESMDIIGKDHMNQPMVSTALTSTKYILANESYNFNNAKMMVAENIANEVVTNVMEATLVTEKVNLNTIKLALQDAKSKLKNLDTKAKNMWATADAYANSFTKGIEKAMTSDRREAIIKGSIIPSFSKCMKSAIALAGTGLIFGPTGAIIAAIGGLGVSAALTAREKKLLYDEIETELKVVEKQIEIAQNDGDMNQYRFLLNYQKKLTREHQRIKYGLKVSGRDIPSATRPD